MSPFYSATMSRIAENTSFNEKKRSEETQTVRAGGAKNFRPAADPLPGDAGRPKFNQLEMVTTHYLYIQTKFGKDRCTQFRVIVVTKPHTHTPHTHTHRQDRLQYTAPQLARSVKTGFSSACFFTITTQCSECIFKNVSSTKGTIYLRLYILQSFSTIYFWHP